MEFLKTLKFQIATALLLVMLLFAGVFSLSMMSIEEQRNYNTLLNISARLEQTAQNLVSLGLLHVNKEPSDFSGYYWDKNLYYQELQGQIALFDEISKGFMTESFPPSLTNMNSPFHPRLGTPAQSAFSAVKEIWDEFKSGITEALGPDNNNPQLNEAALYIATHQATLSESLDALMSQIQRLVDLRLEQVNRLHWGMLIAAMTVTLGIFVWFFLAVLNPLGRAVNGFSKVSRGDFGYQVPVTSHNELALMTNSFNHLSSRLHAIFQLIDQIQRGSNLEETLGFVAEKFPELLPLDWVGALFLAGDNSTITLERSYMNGKLDAAPHNRFRLSKTLLLKAIESGEPLHIPDMLKTGAKNPEFQFLNYLIAHGLRDAIFLPITELSPIPGVLAFATCKAESYTQEHLELLANIAGLITHSFGRTVKLAEHARLAAIGGFASGIAHEIRSPLSTISMALDYLRKTELPLSANKRADLAHKEAGRMARLLEEILLYAKPLQLDLGIIDLKLLIEELLETHKELPEQRKQRFELTTQEQQILIYGDQDRLIQIFLNLARNACDAAPAESVITWHLEKNHAARSVTVEIVNSGEEIPEERLVHLFDAFFTTKRGGTGLGLGIVKRLTEAHGGEVHITSSQQNTKVRVQIPLANDELQST